MAKQWLIVAAVVGGLVLIGAGWLVVKRRAQPAGPTLTLPVSSPAPPTAATPTPPPGAAPEVVVTASNFRLAPAEIRVKQGQTVRVVFKNGQGFHDFTLDEFEVATNRIGEGDEEEVEFTADKTGTFEYYCSVTGHRQLGMKGKLIVE